MLLRYQCLTLCLLKLNNQLWAKAWIHVFCSCRNIKLILSTMNIWVLYWMKDFKNYVIKLHSFRDTYINYEYPSVHECTLVNNKHNFHACINKKVTFSLLKIDTHMFITLSVFKLPAFISVSNSCYISSLITNLISSSR